MIGNALVAPGTGPDYDLSIKRKGLTVAVSKWITPNLSFDASYKFEDKEGSRLFGVGDYCSDVISPICKGASGTVAALYLTPEPIDSTTQQFEAKLTYSGDDVQRDGRLLRRVLQQRQRRPDAGLPQRRGRPSPTPATRSGRWPRHLSQPLALPPDNQSNQFYLAGNTSLPLNTRINYKAVLHPRHAERRPTRASCSSAPRPGSAR